MAAKLFPSKTQLQAVVLTVACDQKPACSHCKRIHKMLVGISTMVTAETVMIKMTARLWQSPMHLCTMRNGQRESGKSEENGAEKEDRIVYRSSPLVPQSLRAFNCSLWDHGGKFDTSLRYTSLASLISLSSQIPAPDASRAADSLLPHLASLAYVLRLHFWSFPFLRQSPPHFFAALSRSETLIAFIRENFV